MVLHDDVWWGFETVNGPGQTKVGDIEFKKHEYSGEGGKGHHEDHHTAKKLALEGAYTNMGVPPHWSF